jgi:hypothetical protein
MATDEEMKAFLAGEDVEGAKRTGSRSGLSASWLGSQAAIVGGGAVFLAFVTSPWWLVTLPMAALLAWKAREASRRHATWERLYGGDQDTERLM